LKQVTDQHLPAVLAALEKGPLTVSEIRAVTGLSKPMAHRVLAAALAVGDVLEELRAPGRRGGPARAYRLTSAGFPGERVCAAPPYRIA
jgi:predicted ArsR family transcriptional regulator